MAPSAWSAITQPPLNDPSPQSMGLHSREESDAVSTPLHRAEGPTLVSGGSPAFSYRQQAIDHVLSRREQDLAIAEARQAGHPVPTAWETWRRFLPTTRKQEADHAMEAFGAARILASSQWPIRKQFPVSSEFGTRWHPIHRELRTHHGIDIAVPVGTAVLASAAGRVQRVTHDRSCGLTVVLDHGHGLITRYCHLSEVLVTTQAMVRRGEDIARSGDSGLTTGPHLHFEARWKTRSVDPRRFLSTESSFSGNAISRP